MCSRKKGDDSDIPIRSTLVSVNSVDMKWTCEQLESSSNVQEKVETGTMTCSGSTATLSAQA